MAAAIPWIIPQYFDNNGQPLAGGKVWTYQAGTNTPIASYTDSVGIIPNPNPVILDGAGRGSIWLKPGNYKIVLMDKNDVVVWTQDKVKPADGGGGGIVDDDYVADGFSLEFNREVSNVVGLQNIIDDIYRWGYKPPSVTLNSNIGTGPYEKGHVISAINFTAGVTKGSNLIEQVEFRQGSTSLDIQTSGGAIPSGGNSTYNWTGSFDDTTTFSARVRDAVTDQGGGGDVVASRTFNFVYPYYVGAGAVGLTASQVAALTKRVIPSTASRQEYITAAAGQVLYFAYPASYGALTVILDENDFNTFSDWQLKTENITGLDGNPVSYRIYEFKNPVVAGTYDYTFVR